MNELSGLASFLASSFKSGGLVMYAILGIGVVAAAIALERFIVIVGASVLNGRKLTNDVLNYINRGDLTSARNVSRMSNAPAAQVVQAVLSVPEIDENKLQSAAEDATALAMPPLTRRLAHLNVMANIATPSAPPTRRSDPRSSPAASRWRSTPPRSDSSSRSPRC